MNDGKKTKKQLIEELHQLRSLLEVNQTDPAGNLENLTANPISGLEDNVIFQGVRQTDWWYYIDSKGFIQEISDGFLSRLGYLKDEILGKQSQDFLTADSKEYVQTVIRPEFKKHGFIHNVYLKFVTKDGQSLPVELSQVAEVDEAGNLVRGRIVLREISSKSKDSLALIESEQRFRTSFEHSAIGKVITDLEGQFIFVNSSLAKMLGYSKDELIKRSWWDFASSDDHRRLLLSGRKLLNGDLKSIRVLTEATHKQGHLLNVDVSIILMRDEDGTPLYLLGEIINISTLINAAKEAQERDVKLNSLFHSAPIGFGLVSDRIVLEVNDWFCDLVGYSRSELIGQDARLLYPSEEEYLWVGKEKYRQISEVGRGTVETMMIKKNGEIINIILSSSALDPNDLSAGVTFSVLDITDRVKIETQLITSEAKLKEAQRLAKLGQWEYDHRTRAIDFSEDVAEIFGFSPHLFTGEEDAILQRIHPEDRELAKNQFLEALNQNIPFEHTLRIKDDKNSIRHVHVKGTHTRSAEGELHYSRGSIQDITNQHKLEEDLRKSHSYLSSILDGIFEGLMVVSPNYEISDVNASFINQYKQTRAEIIGAKCYEITHQLGEPCGSSEHECPLQHVLSSKLPQRVEHRHTSPLYGERVVEIHGFPLLDAYGEVISMVEVINDVTNRVQAERTAVTEAGRAKALTRIANRFNTYLEVQSIANAICEEIAESMNAPRVTVCLSEPDTQEMSLASQFGFTSHTSQFIPEICDMVEELRNPLLTVQAFHYILEDVSEEDAELLSSLDIQSVLLATIQRDNRMIGKIVVLEDARKEYSQTDLTFLQGLTNQAAIALENARLYQLERKSRHESDALRRMSLAVTSTMAMDQVLERILAELQMVVPYDSATIQLLEDNKLKLVSARGFPNQEDLIGASFPLQGRSCYNQVFKTQKPYIENFLKEEEDHLDQGKGNPSCWLGVPMMIGEILIGLITLSKNQTGYYTEKHKDTVLAFAASSAIAVENARLYKDLKDQMQILKKTQDQLVQTEKLSAIGKLVAGIAHELNNPLATILLLAQQSLQEEDLEETTYNLENIVAESKRTAAIVSDLLVFARQQVPEHELHDLNQIIHSVYSNLEPRISEEGIDVSLVLSNNLPPILIDGGQIQQVLINMIQNACQAMMESTNERKLKIVSEIGKPAYPDKIPSSKVLRIKVQDTGPGIHPDVLPHIFEPFYTTKRVGEGTGLGLSISHGIISEHKGNIRAESKYGHGTTMIVELPLIQSPESAPNQPKKSAEKIMPDTGHKILVIDDEQNLLEIIGRVLSRNGYQVISANNGEQGLKLALETNPDLIICDLLMPGIGGKDVFFQLEQLAPELVRKMVFITGDSVSEESSSFLSKTGLPALNKPFELGFFKKFIQETIQQLL